MEEQKTTTSLQANPLLRYTVTGESAALVTPIINRSKKVLTWSDRMAAAKGRLVSNLGLAKTVALKGSFDALNVKAWSAAAANGVIVNLINLGLSNVEIRALIGVGGSRVARLRANPSDTSQKSHVPGHAVTAEDIVRITSHMKGFPKEDVFPYAHRTARQYLLSPTDGGPCPFFNKLDLFLSNTPRGVGLAGPKGG
jgi:hypothetical protein